jgi:hypothetical protein
MRTNRRSAFCYGRRGNAKQVEGPAPIPLRAELIGSNTATALGITVTACGPVLALCRKLIAAGHDAATPLEAFRGDVLCLRVGSIGEAARLEIHPKGTHFIPHRAGRTASPMRQTRRPLVEDHPDPEAAP